MLSLFRSITCFVFDVDGVLTDGSLLVLEGGQLARRMNIRDGYALQLAVKKGYTVIVISGGDAEPVRDRLQRLGITQVFMKAENKSALLAKCMQEQGFSREQVLFMGDDIPDYTVMQQVGLPCCPADAAPEIKAISLYISPVNGGYGCARDVIEKVLKLNDHWDLESGVTAR
jgi:3-deoxy-D-manno-octulosonate 8-phosphate phosphatase (KDO 8-P phosphatase)